MANEERTSLRLSDEMKKEVWIVAKMNIKSLNETYKTMIQYALEMKFGTTSTKKQDFLRQNLVETMYSQDIIATKNAKKDPITFEFAKKALILSGKYGIEIPEIDILRYSSDIAKFLRESSEIDPEQYENNVNVIKKILTKKQFDSLKKLM